MNREIKYRCWVAGKMWRVHSLDFGNNDEIGTRVNVSENGGLGFPLDGVKLMQYIGLKDKNGKEIYEGDILEFFESCVSLYKGRQLFQVKHLRDYAAFIIQNESTWWTVTEEYLKKGSVIGNIHENPVQNYQYE